MESQQSNPSKRQWSDLYIIIILFPRQATCMPAVTLSNINMQISKGKLNTESKFMLKVIVLATTGLPDINLKKPAQFINNQSLIWPESLHLQVNYEQPIVFQILAEVQADQPPNPEPEDIDPPSNPEPEEIDPLYTGYIVIHNPQEDYCGWQAFDKHHQVGHLFANIEIQNKSQVRPMGNSSFFGSTIEVKKDSIAFTSLYAKFPLLGTHDKIRIYLQFQIAGATQRSAIRKIIQGEYHSHQTLQIKHSNPADTKLTVTAFTFEDITNKLVKLGHGSVFLAFSEQQSGRDKQLHERVKLQKVFCCDKDGEQIGWISFKQIKTNDEKLDPRYFLQDKLTTIGDVNFRPLKNESMTKSQIRAASTKPSMSGIEGNSRIFIPTATRFQNPSKFKKCEQIGIGHQSLHINDHPTYIKYRFATLGYGKKITPVERDHEVPGIGRYKLPAIFDRYK